MKEQNKITEEQEQALDILKQMTKLEQKRKKLNFKLKKFGVMLLDLEYKKTVLLLDEVLGEQLASCLINKSSDLVKSIEDIKAIIESR